MIKMSARRPSNKVFIIPYLGRFCPAISVTPLSVRIFAVIHCKNVSYFARSLDPICS